MTALLQLRTEDRSVKSIVVSQFTSFLTLLETPLRSYNVLVFCVILLLIISYSPVSSFLWLGEDNFFTFLLFVTDHFSDFSGLSSNDTKCIVA